MARNVLAVVESETSFVNELVLIVGKVVFSFFVQATVTAPLSASIDGYHSVFSNQERLEHHLPIVIVLVSYSHLAPWMVQVHPQQLPLYLFV